MDSPCGIIPAKWTGVVVRSETPNMAAIVSTWHQSYRVVDHGRHGRYGHRTASMTWCSALISASCLVEPILIAAVCFAHLGGLVICLATSSQLYRALKRFGLDDGIGPGE
jgi:hypothetical protein